VSFVVYERKYVNILKQTNEVIMLVLCFKLVDYVENIYKFLKQQPKIGAVSTFHLKLKMQKKTQLAGCE
jgi:hypothetical protein